MCFQRRNLFLFITLSLAMLLLSFSVIWRPTHAASVQESEQWEPQIAIVWPHDGQGNQVPVDQAAFVNVSVWPRNQVSCTENRPADFALRMAKDSEPLQSVGLTGEFMMRTVGNSTFPSLELNDIPVNLDSEPSAKYRFVYGLTSNVWVHAADPRTILPNPVTPDGYVTSMPEHPDARIQIVWPHDAQGNYVPVEQAPLVNVAVDLFEHEGLRSVPVDSQPATTILLVAENNGSLIPSNQPAQKVTYTVAGDEYPRWVFNDVVVQPGQAYHFALLVGGNTISPYTSVWTHAADARTILPNPQAPPSCIP
jgi:hypothetical protein